MPGSGRAEDTGVDFPRRPPSRGVVPDTPVDRAKQSEFGQLVRFAYGLQKDISAVAAAVDTPWSSGQVEGQINRLKMIKRQMFRRAGFELLRARVLPLSHNPPLAPVQPHELHQKCRRAKSS